MVKRRSCLRSRRKPILKIKVCWKNSAFATLYVYQRKRCWRILSRPSQSTRSRWFLTSHSNQGRTALYHILCGLGRDYAGRRKESASRRSPVPSCSIFLFLPGFHETSGTAELSTDAFGRMLLTLPTPQKEIRVAYIPPYLETGIMAALSFWPRYSQQSCMPTVSFTFRLKAGG